MSNQPQHSFLVTAIVSAYRSGRFIRGCMEDLVGQSLFQRGELEIVVVDSCSPDAECDVILEFATAHPHGIRYLRTSSRESLYRSWNRAIQASRGQFITNANTDDRHRFDALERMAQALLEHSEVDLVYPDSYVTFQADVPMEGHVRAGIHRRPDWSPEIMAQACHMGPQPMWRRSVHDRIGWFDDVLRSAGDYEFWLRMTAAGMRMLHIPEFLCLYYENPKGICNADPGTSQRETKTVIAAYAARIPAPDRDVRDNYFVPVVDPALYARLLVPAKIATRGIGEFLDRLEQMTAYPHVIDVLIEDGADVDLLELRRRQGQIRAVVRSASPDHFAQMEVVLEREDEVAARGWLEARILPQGKAYVGEIPHLDRLAARFRDAKKAIRRLPIILRRTMGKAPRA